MKTLIVNASSKSKRLSTDRNFDYASKSFHELLSKSSSNEFLSCRKTIAEKMQLDDGPDLYGERVDKTFFLPAYIRYSGRTYSKITPEAWESLIKHNDTCDMVILSALYGICRFNEPLRDYSIKQDTKMGDVRIGNYWKKSGAKDWLKEYIVNNKFERVIFVLSTSYANIVQRDKLMEELSELGIETEDKQLKSAGRASMLERGKFINEFLLNL